MEFSNFVLVKAFSRTAEKRKHFCAALEYVYINIIYSRTAEKWTIFCAVLEYVLPVHRNLFES